MRIAAACVVLVVFVAPLRAQTGGVINPPLSPRNANYSIDATLDPANRTITGTELITWRNITTKTVDDLRFHVYWNAWRDDRSTWLRERRLSNAEGSLTRRPNEWARVDVTSVRLLDTTSVDLTSKLQFIAPDDGNADDRTVMMAPLPHSAPPGATLRLAVTWTAHVPRTFARTGAIGNFFFIAQWFPKLGVLQDNGWNCHQFHAGTEFFSDYGVYDVRITVPKGWLVGATGVEDTPRANPDGTLTHQFHQDDVHDFAWTTSPDYIERHARFEHATLPPVDMRLLLQPEHATQAERHFDATRAALRYYGEWFGAYPYGHITIVDPAFQSGAGGMEYPTLFTAGTRWLAPEHVEDPEDVTIHEAGHQFWYGIVGTNEFEDAWMDEGINTFSEARVVATWDGPLFLARRYFGGFVPYVFKDVVLDRNAFDRYGGYRREPKTDMQSTPSYDYLPGYGGVTTYAKTALWLHTMEGWLGWPLLHQIMATYFDRWKFKHPKPLDFFDTVTDVAGRDLGWYFDQVYRSSNAFDYGVHQLTSTAEGKRFRTTVIVRRYGEAISPVDLVVTFEDGQQVVEQWDGRDRWHLYSFDRPTKARSAVVDSNRVLRLDVDRINNSKTLHPMSTAAANTWSLKWMVWLQDCLLSWSALA